jgi:CheY-like chemotaxis protein
MKSILIAMSPSDALSRFSETLSKAGYQVITAHSGEEAIELAASVYPDLFLIAIVMPTLDGLQTASRLRKIFGAQSGRIILLGNVTPIGIDEKPLASLVDGYLDLDVSSQELLACVAKHMPPSRV